MDANMTHLFNKTEISQPKFDTPVTGEELVEKTFNKAEKKLRDHSELSERMADMFTKEEFSDVMIKVGDKRYSAHKIILMNSSEYFCKMFGPDWKEHQQSEVTLNEDNVHCQRYFGEFVKYLYTGTVDVSLDSVLYYLMLADKYLVESLVKTCVKYMDEHFNANPDTERLYAWLCYLDCSSTSPANKLTDVASNEEQINVTDSRFTVVKKLKAFIAWNLPLFVKSRVWVDFEMNLVKEFLQRDDLIVPDEYTLHSWVVEWLKEDKRLASIQDNLKEILPLIRFELMSPAMLDRLLEDEFVQENSEVYTLPYILPAFRCHARSLHKLGTTIDWSSQVYRNIRTYASLESSDDGETAGRSEFGRHFTVENYLDWAKTKHNFGNFKVPVNPSFTDRFRKVDCEVSVYPKGTCISEEYIQDYYDSRGEQSQRMRKVQEDDHFRLDICLKLPKNVMCEWEISAIVICLQNRVKYIKRVTTKKPPVDKPTYSFGSNEVTAQAPPPFGIATPSGSKLASAQRRQPTSGFTFGSSLSQSTVIRAAVYTSPEYKECTNFVTSIIDSVKLTDLRKENSEYIIDGNIKFIVVCKPQYNANDKGS